MGRGSNEDHYSCFILLFIKRSIGHLLSFRFSQVKFWLKQLSTEVEERLIKDKDAVRENDAIS